MPIPDSKPEIIELTIDRLSYNGGRGVGRYNDIVVFVPDTAPNERVRAQVVEKKSNFWSARLVEVLVPSPARRLPPCPVANTCGGCSWQHINYSEQLHQKEEILRHALRKLSVGEFLPILPSPNEFRYRNRVQVHVEGQKLGFFAKNSNTIVPIEDCLIADERLIEKFTALRAENQKPVRRVELSLRDLGEGAFAQVNSEQNENLIKSALMFVQKNPQHIFDLYAGGGNFSLPLARKFPEAKVTAVEFNKDSCRDGTRLAAGLRNVQWFQGDVGEFLRQSKPRHDLFVLIDPPRTGCDKVTINELLRLNPEQIVYVSCNPMTFTRDCERLSSAYTVAQLQPVDMFPQTEHIELVASLISR